MRIAIAQMSVKQGEFETNLQKADTLAQKAKEQCADLILFPEMFVCGFNYRKNLEFVSEKQQLLLDALSAIAKQHRIWLAGSIPFLDTASAKPYNRFMLIDDNGNEVAHYNKIHLFSLFKEDKYSAFGENAVVVETKFGKIGFAICYDLRFAEQFNALSECGAKIILLSAAWPYPRLKHWEVLLKARAIENQIFVAAANQCGIENFTLNKVEYFGASQIIDAWGETIADCGTDTPDTLAIADVDLNAVEEARVKIPVSKDRRGIVVS